MGFDISRGERPAGARARRIGRELQQLRDAPDGTVKSTTILGEPLHLVSNRAFVRLYTEIIKREIYRFAADTDAPSIIDCGANIGVGVVYFKSRYPKARVLCFEPAPDVFPVLERNIASFGLGNVTALPCGVWDREAELRFRIDPQSTAGCIVGEREKSHDATIKVVRLRDYLDRRVHLLKMDIEGAEATVIPDIADRLENVDNIFVEYHSRVNKEQRLDKIIQHLASSGFRLYIENTRKLAPQPFVDRNCHKGMDLLLNIYGVRSRQ